MSHANDEPPNALILSRYQLRISVSDRARLKMRTDWMLQFAYCELFQLYLPISKPLLVDTFLIVHDAEPINEPFTYTLRVHDCLTQVKCAHTRFQNVVEGYTSVFALPSHVMKFIRFQTRLILYHFATQSNVEELIFEIHIVSAELVTTKDTEKSQVQNCSDDWLPTETYELLPLKFPANLWYPLSVLEYVTLDAVPLYPLPELSRVSPLRRYSATNPRLSGTIKSLIWMIG